MCGRITATFEFEFHEIKLRWDIQRDLEFAPRYNIAPSQKVLYRQRLKRHSQHCKSVGGNARCSLYQRLIS